MDCLKNCVSIIPAKLCNQRKKFYHYVELKNKGILHLHLLSETNNLVSCQVEGRRMQYLRCGNIRKNTKGLHMVFIYLEKAYDIVPRQEVLRCIREKGVSEKYVRIVQNMYEGVRTRVKAVYD